MNRLTNYLDNLLPMNLSPKEVEIYLISRGLKKL